MRKGAVASAAAAAFAASPREGSQTHRSFLLRPDQQRLRDLQELRDQEADMAVQAIEALSEEILRLERVRADEGAEAALTIEELRGDNAMLTTAAYRVHEQWRRDACELASLKAELTRLDVQCAAERCAAEGLLQRGAGLAEERFRSSERGRAVDVSLLARELDNAEETGAALLAEHQLFILRLLAENRSLKGELAAAEAEREATMEIARLTAAHTARLAAADASATVAELTEVGERLEAEVGKLEEVGDALRVWEACDGAERAKTLSAMEALEGATSGIDATASLALAALNSAPRLGGSGSGSPSPSLSHSLSASGWAGSV
jgi:hypothetical protein